MVARLRCYGTKCLAHGVGVFAAPSQSRRLADVGKVSTSFKPGVSGNPGGRPKILGEIKELARNYGPDAIAKLAQLSGLVRGHPGAENESARIAALRELLDRGYGKPIQPTDITSNGESVRYVVLSVPEAENTDEWLKQYAPPMIEGPS